MEFFIFCLIVFLCFVLALKGLKKPKAASSPLREGPTSKSVALPYGRIGPLYTPAERSLLGVLEYTLDPSQYRIVGKVRLADLIRTTPGLSNSQRQT
ncbi:MAG: hypothetical protein KY468_18165, partial [Armatimonadetes bacterium]|nr:hypothetical protein [Armatimonadota bacterium]